MYSAVYTTKAEMIAEHILCDTTAVTFSGVSLDLVSALEIGGTDDNIEFLITDASNGDEYGIISRTMTAAQMAAAVNAANEMYADQVAALAA